MSGEQLLSGIERIERLHEEKRNIEGDIKDIYAELKGAGYDTKAIRELVKRRAKDPDARSEFEAIVDLYEQEIANASRAHTRDAREGDHETAGSTVRLSGNAALSSPVAQAPETGHVDRSASARPRDAVGNGVNPAVNEPSCWQGQGVREPVTGNAQPSGAGTGSAVRTGAPSFEAA